MQTACGQVSASSLILLPVFLWVDAPWAMAMPAAMDWVYLFLLGTFCTALAYILYFKILREAGTTNLLLLNFLVPVFATAMGVALLGEVLAVNHIIGLVIISAGLLIMDGRVLRPFQTA